MQPVAENWLMTFGSELLHHKASLATGQVNRPILGGSGIIVALCVLCEVQTEIAKLTPRWGKCKVRFNYSFVECTQTSKLYIV